VEDGGGKGVGGAAAVVVCCSEECVVVPFFSWRDCNKELTQAVDSALYFGPFFLPINTTTRSSPARSRKKEKQGQKKLINLRHFHN